MVLNWAVLTPWSWQGRRLCCTLWLALAGEPPHHRHWLTPSPFSWKRSASMASRCVNTVVLARRGAGCPDPDGLAMPRLARTSRHVIRTLTSCSAFRTTATTWSPPPPRLGAVSQRAMAASSGARRGASCWRRACSSVVRPLLLPEASSALSCLGQMAGDQRSL
jgi:hypothetical protein